MTFSEKFRVVPVRNRHYFDAIGEVEGSHCPVGIPQKDFAVSAIEGKTFDVGIGSWVFDVAENFEQRSRVAAVDFDVG